MDHAVGYVRVSTSEQDLGADAQLERIQAYCKLKGLGAPNVYQDLGVSSAIPLFERPSGKLLQGLQGCHLVIAKLDRAWRNARECLDSVDFFQEQGVTVHLLDLSVDLSSPLGRFFLTVTAAFAEMERARLRERTREGLEALRRRGGWPGRVGYGLRRDENGMLQPVPSEIRWLERIWDWTRNGADVSEIHRILSTCHRPKGWAKRPSWGVRTIRKQLERIRKIPQLHDAVTLELDAEAQIGPSHKS